MTSTNDSVATPAWLRWRHAGTRMTLITEGQALLNGVPAAALRAWQALHLPGMALSHDLEATAATITSLLDQGVPVDLLKGNGQTLLARLAEHRPPPVALMITLIQHGASIDVPVPTAHRTGLAVPLWERLIRDVPTEPELVQRLLDRGLAPDSTVPGNTQTPLGLLDLAILGTKTRHLTNRGRATITVPEAVQDRLIATLDVLLDRGANVNGVAEGDDATDPAHSPSSPLRRCLSGWAMLRVAQHLVDRGARLADRYRFSITTARTSHLITTAIEDRGTLLHQVAASGGLEAVRWLVETHNLDPNDRTDRGATVLEVVQQRSVAPPTLVAYLEARTLRCLVKETQTVERTVGRHRL